MTNHTFSKPLILGSEGLIGTALKSVLERKGIDYIPYDIKLTEDHDLAWTQDGREKPSLRLALHDCDFVFFLAYDVGGSKYLEAKQHDYNFLQTNSRMMENVFSNLKLSGKPFVFASSMMAHDPRQSSYGGLKKLGELYAKSLGGVSARFWNVFGEEERGEKSHIVPDLINEYYARVIEKWSDHRYRDYDEIYIYLRTNGLEKRQFISAEHSAHALLTLMENYKEREKYFNKGQDTSVIDISSGEWLTIKDLAKTTLNISKEVIQNKVNHKVFPPVVGVRDNAGFAQFNIDVEPNLMPIVRMGWNPHTNLEEEIRKVSVSIMNKKFKKQGL